MERAESIALPFVPADGRHRGGGDSAPAPAESATPIFGTEELGRHRLLVTRMAEGDAEALRLLIGGLGGKLQGVAQRILRDPEAARETVQDTFVKAWKQAGGYRAERGEVVSWLVFITRNGAIDRLRRQARQRELLNTLKQEETADLLPPPREAFERREAVEHGLIRLSAPQRRALELAFFDGCTQSEIALAMRVPVGNVKNHLRRGLHKLRELFSVHD